MTDRTKEMCTSLSYAPRLTGLEGHDRIQHKLYTSITGPKVKAKFPSSIENKTGLFVCLFVCLFLLRRYHLGISQTWMSYEYRGSKRISDLSSRR